jgi:hypothetical protein
MEPKQSGKSTLHFTDSIASSGAAMMWYARWNYAVVIARCSLLIAFGFWLFGLFLNNFGDLFPG